MPSRDVIDALAEIEKFGSGLGLHRMAWLCRSVADGDWLAGLDAVKVTGSNGKGSVCAMLASIFDHLPVSHGLYSSPHLRHFRERIAVDGRNIADRDLEAAWSFVEARVRDYESSHPGERFGAFEVFTALALRHFSAHRPDLLIAEAGIGGRYDSTRVIPGRLAAITSLDLEHTRLLGDRLELIAYDKADLCPDGGTLVVGGGMDPEVLRRLEGYATMRGIEILAVDEVCRLLRYQARGTSMVVDMTTRQHSYEHLEIALAGRHQWSNAAVALLLAEQWTARHLPDLPRERLVGAVRAGLREVSLAGRFQKVSQDPDIYIDVGHTPEAARALAAVVRDVLPGPILLVTGVSENKNAEDLVPALLTFADEVICTRAWHLGSPARRLEQIVRATRPDLPVWRAETIDGAVNLARERARRQGSRVVVAGGLFLSIEASECLEGRDPRGLRFF